MTHQKNQAKGQQYRPAPPVFQKAEVGKSSEVSYLHPQQSWALPAPTTQARTEQEDAEYRSNIEKVPIREKSNARAKLAKIRQERGIEPQQKQREAVQQRDRGMTR